MESKEIKCNLGEEKRYSLEDKIAILTKMGIDYISANEKIPLKYQQQNIEKIINKIKNNQKLLEKLENIKDDIFDEAIKKGIIMYSETAWMNEEENIIGKRQYCKNETFETVSGKIIDIKEGQEVPVLAYQKKKIIELNKIY